MARSHDIFVLGITLIIILTAIAVSVNATLAQAIVIILPTGIAFSYFINNEYKKEQSNR